MFSILGDEVSHVSAFSKLFWKPSDAHNIFTIAWMLGLTSGSSWVYIPYTYVVWSASQHMIWLSQLYWSWTIMDFGLGVF